MTEGAGGVCAVAVEDAGVYVEGSGGIWWLVDNCGGRASRAGIIC